MTSPFVKTAVQCSMCNKTKQEANHWFLIFPNSYYSTDLDQTVTGLLLTHFDDKLLIVDGVMPVCGESCALKALSQSISKLETR